MITALSFFAFRTMLPATLPNQFTTTRWRSQLFFFGPCYFRGRLSTTEQRLVYHRCAEESTFFSTPASLVVRGSPSTIEQDTVYTISRAESNFFLLPTESILTAKPPGREYPRIRVHFFLDSGKLAWYNASRAFGAGAGMSRE